MIIKQLIFIVALLTGSMQNFQSEKNIFKLNNLSLFYELPTGSNLTNVIKWDDTDGPSFKYNIHLSKNNEEESYSYMRCPSYLKYNDVKFYYWGLKVESTDLKLGSYYSEYLS